MKRGATYGEVAEYFHKYGFYSAKGKKWSKESIRTFMQNPIHAGYFQSFGKKNGQKDTRGPLHLHRANIAEPVVSLDEWKRCNPVMMSRSVTVEG